MAIRLQGASTAPNKREIRLCYLLKTLVSAGALGLLLCGSTGCTLTSGACRALQHTECIDDFMIDYRNRAMAEKAWHCQKQRFANHTYLRDFKAGFIDGYLDIANGGYGCCPTVAPKKYWGWRYQSPQGQQAVNAWFAGFPMGVRAAEQDGVGHWSQVQWSGVVPTPAEHYAPTMEGQVVPMDAVLYPEGVPVPVPQDAVDQPGIESPMDLNPGVQPPEILPVPEQVDPLFNQNQTPVELELSQEPLQNSDLVSRYDDVDRPIAGTTTLSDQQPATTTKLSEADMFAPPSTTGGELNRDDKQGLPFSFE